MTKSFFTVRAEAYADMVARKDKLLKRSGDAFRAGDLDTMHRAHSLAMKQDDRTVSKYRDDHIKHIMSGATKDYADRDKKYGPGKVRDSVEYPEDTNVIDEGVLDFMSSSTTKPKSKLTLSAMRDIARREDLKKNMNKVVRSQNEPQNAIYRSVRSEEKEDTEYNYEGDMTRGQMRSIITNAQRVHDMLKDDDNLPEWVQSKVTLAEDYISTVANYLVSEVNEAKKMKGKDPCWSGYKMLGTKPKNGKQVPNCIPEETQEIDEAQKSAAARLQRALQKAREDRERSERNAERLLNPDNKKIGEPKKQGVAEGLADAQQKIQDTINKLEDRLKHAKTPEQWDNIKNRIERLQAGLKRSQQGVAEGMEEGIARLISKSIKRVTAVKPTPQEKADIRLNK